MEDEFFEFGIVASKGDVEKLQEQFSTCDFTKTVTIIGPVAVPPGMTTIPGGGIRTVPMVIAGATPVSPVSGPASKCPHCGKNIKISVSSA